VGAASFSCVAFAMAPRIGSADAAAPATNITILPLYFISGVFVSESMIPESLRNIATVFPIHHLDEALLKPVIQTHGTGIAATDLLIVAAWGVAALLIAARTFQWSPREG
jgi:ABC-2 type transport system permease protein